MLEYFYRKYDQDIFSGRKGDLEGYLLSGRPVDIHLSGLGYILKVDLDRQRLLQECFSFSWVLAAFSGKRVILFLDEFQEILNLTRFEKAGDMGYSGPSSAQWPSQRNR